MGFQYTIETKPKWDYNENAGTQKVDPQTEISVLVFLTWFANENSGKRKLFFDLKDLKEKFILHWFSKL